LRREGIEVGVALLQRTPAESILDSLDLIDHVLIFSGNLGFQGGSEADLNLLKKVTQVKSAKPSVEIGWDGGVNDQNAAQIAAGGVDVLNVGSFIMQSENPLRQYRKIEIALDQ